jgi:hypothetical protein
MARIIDSPHDPKPDRGHENRDGLLDKFTSMLYQHPSFDDLAPPIFKGFS